MTTTPALTHVFVPVRDQDEALAFYRDVLGFEVRQDMPFDGFRWLTIGSPSHPDIEINLENPFMGRSKEDGEAILALVAKGVMSSLIFRTDQHQFKAGLQFSYQQDEQTTGEHETMGTTRGEK